MNAHFCTVTGARIVAPGVSKDVDPKNGQDLAEPPPPAPGRMTPEQQAELVKALDEAHARQMSLEEQLEISAERHRAQMHEALDAQGKEHKREVERLNAEHAAEIERLKAAHAAELDALTKPADPEAPGAVQEEPPTAEAVPRPARRGNNR